MVRGLWCWGWLWWGGMSLWQYSQNCLPGVRIRVLSVGPPWLGLLGARPRLFELVEQPVCLCHLTYVFFGCTVVGLLPWIKVPSK